ncbi:type II secretion system minor pseudopilin GspK [Pseudomonas sp. R5(2019)]|uniref:type II secretion system minor pseudopilin GspK n=1 Tax=Pseudomonas sp. R5(2019) TaxID=2697566 RepID=UPI001412D8D8|nr:type II secretion system minor pseudopilin GspK [Pseudomonas sp. R5(2019)]NBA98011.1 type II secretion system minor pseudopilin GspK [Pseudomonas sp. R5(2019)]
MAKHGQQGVALLMVLVVLAMLAGGLTWVVEQGRQQVEATRLLKQRVQARAIESAALAFVEQALKSREWRANPLFWQALRGAALPYGFEGGKASLRIRDLHSCFNVNALIGADHERALRQLEHLLGGDMAAEQLAQSLADWLDNDNDTRLMGAESNQYLRLSPSRLAANQMMSDISEINLVMPADPGRHLRYPQLCALPETAAWRLNANTLRMDMLPLLEALYEGEVSRSLLTRLISARPEAGYRVPEDLRKALGAVDDALFNRITEGLLLNSGHFVVQLEIDLDGRVLRSQHQVQARGVVDWHSVVPVQQVMVRSREPMVF